MFHKIILRTCKNVRIFTITRIPSYLFTQYSVAHLLMQLNIAECYLRTEERCVMWLGIIILGYFTGVFLLIRFLQAVHQWDDEIEAMEIQSRNITKKNLIHYRSAS